MLHQDGMHEMDRGEPTDLFVHDIMLFPHDIVLFANDIIVEIVTTRV